MESYKLNSTQKREIAPNVLQRHPKLAEEFNIYFFNCWGKDRAINETVGNQ